MRSIFGFLPVQKRNPKGFPGLEVPVGLPGLEVTVAPSLATRFAPRSPVAAQVGLPGFEVTKVLISLFKMIPLFLFGVDAGIIC